MEEIVSILGSKAWWYQEDAPSFYSSTGNNNGGKGQASKSSLPLKSPNLAELIIREHKQIPLKHKHLVEITISKNLLQTLIIAKYQHIKEFCV